MSRVVAIRAGLHWVGVNDRETDLFEGLWPLPGGISYNAYLLAGEQAALIDAVRAPYLPELLEKIRGLAPGGLDYLVVNHIEPDHAGALGVLLELFPRMRIVGNAKTLDFLAAYHGIVDRTRALADGEVLDLGRHRLRALLTPMVHWPETMMTFEESGRVLFTGDVFGGYGALGAGIDVAEREPAALEGEARRYYANVLGKYSGMIGKALARVDDAAPAALLPAHGPIWERNAAVVRGWYERWSRYEAEEGVVIAYASMYQNTKRLAESVAEGCAEAGVRRVALHDVSRTHPSLILGELWRHRCLALGSPTYNTELFPAMAHLVRLIRNKRMGNRLLGVFGSYGWSGGALAELRELGGDPGWRLVDPAVEVRGAPREPDLERCRLLGRELAAASREPR
jgi:flavorubredoxin